MLSPMDQIGITYTQVLQEEKIFPMINWDQSDWLIIAWDMQEKCSEISLKNSQKNFLWQHL